MKKGEIYTGVVEYADFPNKCRVRVEKDAQGNNVLSEDGQTEYVTVKNCIPGQRISFMVNKKRGGKCEGRFLEVIDPSPIETNKACPHFGQCGGCIYQTVSYEEQLKIKAVQVKKLLDEVITDDYVFEGIQGSPKYSEYRNKMEFSFGDEYKDGPLALGLHKRNSMYDIVTVSECQIIDEDYRKILKCVHEYALENKLPFKHKTSHEGYLRHLLVRKAVKTGEILVDIVTTTQMNHDMTRLSEKLQNLCLDGRIVGFLHTFNDSLADAIVNERTEVIYGRDYIEAELLGLRFKISAFSFFQTNSLGAEVLYSKAREYVLSGDEFMGGKKPVLYDLYTGTGTIAQILAPVSKKVIGVEIVPEAVEAARVNATLNGLSNCEFIADDVLKALDGIEQMPDYIVLDPPRDGIHPKALEKIALRYKVRNMVYISCKPTSLARDLVALQEYGYKVSRVSCVDMFPGTGHVET
ncbi:MAG: 23S rRNA (uracil(1939)-C(5))-methyltransferase RlmD, partial [Lachnospira sp.]